MIKLSLVVGVAYNYTVLMNYANVLLVIVSHIIQVLRCVKTMVLYMDSREALRCIYE